MIYLYLTGGDMKNLKTITLLAAVALNLFLGLFALDVLNEGSFGVDLVLGFLIHLLPNLVLALATFIAYKRTLWGGVAFFVLGIFTVFFFHSYRSLPTFLITSLPMLVLGGVFVVLGKKRNKTEEKV